MATEFPMLDEYFHSHTLGSYMTNLALIKLAPEASFWLAENEPTLDRWCVFAHEYAHFLHNFSTISGLYDFLTHLRLEGLFIQTVGVDGNSHGTKILEEQERLDFEKWRNFRRHLLGQVGYPFNADYHRRNVCIRITEVNRTQSSLQFSTQSFPLEIESVNVSFLVSSSSTPEESCSAVFGSWHIMEALAYEIERTVFKANGANFVEVDSKVPMYPYKVGRLLFEHLAKMSPPTEVFSRVCLMALQSSDPGASFVDIAIAFANRDAREAAEDILGRLESITLSKVREMADDIINRTLRPEFDRFASRGAMGKAVAALGNLCCEYVRTRSNDLFFELHLFEQTLDRESLRHLIQSFPPCPIVHEAKSGGKAEFFNLSLTELSSDTVDALCVYQTSGQFMFAHLCQDGFSQTSQCLRSKCIFFGACAAPQATNAPELCQVWPWTAFRKSDESACMYAAGVSASRGRADL